MKSLFVIVCLLSIGCAAQTETAPCSPPSLDDANCYAIGDIHRCDMVDGTHWDFRAADGSVTHWIRVNPEALAVEVLCEEAAQ